MPVPSARRASLAIVGAVLLVATIPAVTAPGDANWPYWRGPAADGMAVGDAPVTWSATENVRWKTDIPGLGNSSPIVWGDFVFVTTAIKTGRRVVANAAASTAGGTGDAAGPARWRARRGAGRRGRAAGGTQVRRALPRPQDRQDPLAAHREDGRAARRRAQHLRQLRLELARDRRQVRLRVLRIARDVLLRLQGHARLAEGLRRADAHADGVRRGHGPGAVRQQADPRVRPRGRLVHGRARQGDREGNLAREPRREDELGGAAGRRRSRAAPRSSSRAAPRCAATTSRPAR